MANKYLYGAYGHLGETIAQSSIQAGTVPIYVGVAPVNLVREYHNKDLTNRPLKIINLQDAQQKAGYSKNWGKYSLCEVFQAHFNNPNGNIGPIYIINVLDPEKHRKEEVTKLTVEFKNGKTEFTSDTIILDTLLLSEKMENIDFAVDYNFTKGTVLLSSLDLESPLNGEVEVTYNEVDPLMIATEDIIGTITEKGEYSGLQAINLLYQEQYQVANLIASPGWSEKPEVYHAMITAAQNINGHWEAFVMADMPIIDGDTLIDTISKAQKWQKDKNYTSERSKPYWPQVQDALGNIFHGSTLAMVEQMRVDHTHDSIPMETCGNKSIPVVKQYFGKDSKNRGFDQQQANELTQQGINTMVFWGGRWVLWGDHTAAYAYGKDMDARGIFDVNIRMLLHIINSFQREWGITIDKPMTIQLKDRILNQEQEKLDALVGRGALIGHPQVLFTETSNSTAELMNGDFRWDITVTPTPPFKSGSVYVSYTDAGFTAYFERVGE